MADSVNRQPPGRVSAAIGYSPSLRAARLRRLSNRGAFSALDRRRGSRDLQSPVLAKCRLRRAWEMTSAKPRWRTRETLGALPSAAPYAPYGRSSRGESTFDGDQYSGVDWSPQMNQVVDAGTAAGSRMGRAAISFAPVGDLLVADGNDETAVLVARLGASDDGGQRQASSVLIEDVGEVGATEIALAKRERPMDGSRVPGVEADGWRDPSRPPAAARRVR